MTEPFLEPMATPGRSLVREKLGGILRVGGLAEKWNVIKSNETYLKQYLLSILNSDK